MLFLTEANKLENEQKKLERIQLSTIELILKNNLSDDTDIFKRFSEDRLSEHYCTKLELIELLKNITLMKNSIQNKDGEQISDLLSLKNKLICILNDIQSILTHSQLKLKELVPEEKLLSEEIKIFADKMIYWTKPIDLNANSTKNLLDTNLPKEVKTFMDFVTNSNGHENGWLPLDHQIFVKYRKKFNDEELIYHLHRVLPDISESNIRKHIMWYDRYDALKAKQKDAIKTWQEGKKVEQNIPDDDELLKTSVEITIKDYNRMKLKDEIKNWKEKIKKDREGEQQKVVLNKMREKQIDQHKKILNKIKKLEVEEWKNNKIKEKTERIKNQELVEQSEKEIKKTVANKMIKMFQIQDLDFLERKKAKENLRSVSIPNLSRNTSTSKGDPNRLHKPTEQWLNRIMTSDCRHNQPINQICNIPKLGTPAWRKGVF